MKWEKLEDWRQKYATMLKQSGEWQKCQARKFYHGYPARQKSRWKSCKALKGLCERLKVGIKPKIIRSFPFIHQLEV
jgi:hypothetical protein